MALLGNVFPSLIVDGKKTVAVSLDGMCRICRNCRWCFLEGLVDCCAKSQKWMQTILLLLLLFMVYLLKHCNTAAKKPKCTVYKKVIEKHYY